MQLKALNLTLRGMCNIRRIQWALVLWILAFRPGIAAPIPLGPPNIPDTQVLNATWRSQGPVLFVWVNGNGQCPAAIPSEKPAFLFTTGVLLKGEWRYAIPQELSICADVASNEAITVCKSGTVRVENVAEHNELRGDYDLTFEDGSAKRGRFRAQYCPPDK